MYFLSEWFPVVCSDILSIDRVIAAATSFLKAADSRRDLKKPLQSEQFFRMGNAPGSLALPATSAMNKFTRAGRVSTVYHRVVAIPEASIVASISKAGLLSVSHLDTGIMVSYKLACSYCTS